MRRKSAWRRNEISNENHGSETAAKWRGVSINERKLIENGENEE
jgi:hypothetical protein